MWAWFVAASLALAITAGFGLGAALFAAPALHAPLGLWWPAATQAHGHVQIFGWAGLMVLGIGLHFLPRLRGAPPPRPDRAAAALALLVAGLVLRALDEPVLAAAAGTGRIPFMAPLRAILLGSGLLELLGASLVILELALLARRGPPLRAQARLWPLLPFFVTAFAALWLALAANFAGLAAAVASGDILVPDWADQLSIQLAFYGFLVPVSVAMAERTFPLFLRTPLPDLRLLRGTLALLLAGLFLRMGGELADAATAAGLGRIALAAALVLFAWALGVFAPRRPLPRQPVRPLANPIQWHVLAAFAWLVLAALLLLSSGLAALGIRGIVPTTDPADAERHLLGAGFVTLLILGMGAQLLPGFANRRLRHRALVWATVILGSIAALLRVAPLFAPSLLTSLSASLASAMLATAGVAGLAALAAFGANLSPIGRRERAGSQRR